MPSVGSNQGGGAGSGVKKPRRSPRFVDADQAPEPEPEPQKTPYRPRKTASHPFVSLDVVRIVVSFCPDRSYVFVGGISRTCREAWRIVKVKTETSVCRVGPTSHHLLVSFQHLGLPKSTAVCRAAARSGNIQCMVVAKGMGCKLDSSVGVEAARKGDVRMLGWLRRNCKDWDAEATCTAAAGSGNIDALMWCRGQKFAWGFQACRAAVRSGSVEAQKYSMVEASSPEPLSESNNPRLYVDAIRERQFGILDWLSESELFSSLYDRQGAFEAIVEHGGGSRAATATLMKDIFNSGAVNVNHNGMVKIVSLGRKHFHLLERIPDVSSVTGNALYVAVAHEAIRQGSLFMFDRLVERGFRCDEPRVLADALFHGHMGLLTTLIERGRKWTSTSKREGFVRAASQNRVGDLRACVGQPGGDFVFGNDRGKDLCAAAASSGSVDALRFCLGKTSRPLGDNICLGASRNGKTRALRVAAVAGAPLSYACIEGAIENGHVETLTRMLDADCLLHRFPGKIDMGSVAEFAVSDGQLRVLRHVVAGGLVPASADILNIVLTESCPIQRYSKLELCLEACPETTISDEALASAVDQSEYLDEIQLLYTKVSEKRWRKAFPALWRVERSGRMEEWLESTRTW